MIHRYKPLEVPNGILERRKLISDNSGRRVVLTDSSKAYAIGGTLIRPNNKSGYIVTGDNAERIRLRYENLVGMMVQIPHLSVSSEMPADELERIVGV